MTDDYLKLFLDSPFGDEPPYKLFLLLLLGMMRILPIVSLAPFLGSRVLNMPAKVMLGVVIYLVLFPKVLTVSSTHIEYDIRFVGLLFKELFIGFVIGFMTTIPFFIAESAGVLIDHQRGSSSLMVNDPIIQAQNSPIGVLFNGVGVVIFYWINGPFFFFDAMIQSYDVIAPDQFLSQLFFQKGTPFFENATTWMAKEMAIAVQIAMPSLVTILMTDMFLGLANRLAPQVMITFLGLPLKSYLGIAILWLAWAAVTTEFQNQYILWLQSLIKMIHQFF